MGFIVLISKSNLLHMKDFLLSYFEILPEYWSSHPWALTRLDIEWNDIKWLLTCVRKDGINLFYFIPVSSTSTMCLSGLWHFLMVQARDVIALLLKESPLLWRWNLWFYFAVMLHYVFGFSKSFWGNEVQKVHSKVRFNHAFSSLYKGQWDGFKGRWILVLILKIFWLIWFPMLKWWEIIAKTYFTVNSHMSFCSKSTSILLFCLGLTRATHNHEDYCPMYMKHLQK